MADVRRNMGRVVRVDAGMPATCPVSRVAAMGWNDARDGRGYRPEYEAMRRDDQLLYETGRLYAVVSSRVEGAKAPKWTSRKKVTQLKLSRASHDAMRDEFDFIGGKDR